MFLGAGCPVTCLACGEQSAGLKRLAWHVSSAHGLSSFEYTVVHLCDGVRPTCVDCERETRYVSFSFKKRCAEHAVTSMAEGGAAPRFSMVVELASFVRSLGSSADVVMKRSHDVVWRVVVIDDGALVACVVPLVTSRCPTAVELDARRAIVFFEDEWRVRRAACEGVLAHALGASVRCGARECELRKIDSKTSACLLESWHLAGNTKSTVGFCLSRVDDPLVVLTLREPFHRSHVGAVEVARMAVRSRVSVAGGLSRLLAAASSWAHARGLTSALSYVDLRFGTGTSLEVCGFVRERVTENWWWTDGVDRFNRFKFKADRERGLSEKQVAAAAGVRKIYGLGNAVYVKTL